ncbi:UDP-3-O-(3-hydroxymyristoyl)glucosamine N-acyltransferase [Parachlamydia sp. AcF125]|uniref:UDP-3-O-(3-hydroxymyristoyl)glucosamine N-acyltransferase n=1 Tax=Parachlamydia sp. AcF125 TaxID=2795736 RepID=UPI0032D5A3F8
MKKAFTLSELAELTQATLVGNPHHTITGVADLASAGENDASFLSRPKYTSSRYDEAMRKSKAGVVFISPDTFYDKTRNVLIVEDPSRAFQLTLEAFFEEKRSQSGFLGIHSTAVVHETAVIGQNVTLGPYCVIDHGVHIGANTTIGAGCYIGSHTFVGSDCFFYPHVTIRERCQIGNRVILQPGVIIGSCGFGYTTDAKGQHTKLNQIGIVLIEDDVEIGANVTIDRARFKETRIGKGSKIDNAVQIAHGVTIGAHCLIVAQTGIAGSTKIGNHVVIGGQAAVGGHLEIASGVIIAAKSGVTKSLKEPGKYGGFPVIPLSEHNRQSVQARNIGKYLEHIEKLEKRLESLEKKSSEN